MKTLTTVVLVLSAGVALAAEGVTLTEEGRPRAAIVLCPEAIPAEVTAAEQLQSYLRQITGARLTIRREPPLAETTRVWVGPSENVRKLLPDVDWEALGSDGIVIRTVGSDLILAGGRPRGTLYAVYTFLEEALGCRWWTNYAEHIPTRSTLTLPALDTVYRPPFDYRENYGEGVQGRPYFAAKLRLNGGSMIWVGDLTEEVGGYMSMGGAHTAIKVLLPPDEYFEQHPEWYAWREEIFPGYHETPRTHYAGTLCYTNPEAAREAGERAVQLLAEQPADPWRERVLSVSCPDTASMPVCQCPECTALREAEGSQAGPLLQFVNAVAERVAEEYPEARITTLSYLTTERPPLNLRPRENVTVVFAMLNRNHALPPQGTPRLIPYLEKWTEISSEVWIWDYWVGFYNYIWPFPNHFIRGEFTRLYAQLGVRGIFTQMAWGGLAEFLPLRQWMYAQLLWNPQQDDRALAREFLEGYYGAAGPYLYEYLELINTEVRRSQDFLGLRPEASRAWLRPEVLEMGTRLFAQAREAVAHDEELLRRVRRSQASVDLVWLVRYRELRRAALEGKRPFLGPGDPYAAVAAFGALLGELGTAGAGGGTWRITGGDLLTPLQNRYPRPAPPPPEAGELPPGRWEDIQENMMQGQDMEIVADPQASSGYAARVPAEAGLWLHAPEEGVVRFVVPADLAGRWRVYVRLRCETEQATEEGVHLGIYAPGEVVRVEIPCHPQEPGYRTVDLGTHDLPVEAEIWVRPGGLGGCEAIVVDRMVLVED